MKNTSTFVKILILLSTISIIAIVCFLSVAFVKAEINPFLWGEGSRFMLVFTIILVSVVPIGMILGELNNSSK
jgi:hypothetical protein